MSLPWEITGVGGRPVLLMEPHGVDSHPNALAIRGREIAVPSGARIIDTDPAKPTASHTLEFLAETRDAVAFLEDFFDARQGKAEGFWVPLSQWEFDVYGYEMPNFNSYYLAVRHTAYSTAIFPLGAAFRHLLMTSGDRWHLHTIDAVTPNAAPGFDSIHMQGPLGAHSTDDVPLLTLALTAPRNDAYRPLRLVYCRFDQDELVSEVINGDGACRVSCTVVELPDEVPT